MWIYHSNNIIINKYYNLITNWNQIWLQDANSPIKEEFIFFHDFIITVLIFIITLVGYIIISLIYNKLIYKSLIEGQLLECVWTFLPAFILVQVALPSLILLYNLDDASDTSVTLKVNGHQWYWSYEYSDFWSSGFDSSLEFDSYIASENIIAPGLYRLLDVDYRPVLTYLVQTRVLITSRDVLHCWTVPRLGVKADANPGRLNQVKFISYRPGIYYGQCSEICGRNHRFIPISLEFLRAEDFLSWIITASHD